MCRWSSPLSCRTEFTLAVLSATVLCSSEADATDGGDSSGAINASESELDSKVAEITSAAEKEISGENSEAAAPFLWLPRLPSP